MPVEPTKKDDRLVQFVVTVMLSAEEEGVFAAMLAQFLARASDARSQLDARALPVCAQFNTSTRVNHPIALDIF